MAYQQPSIATVLPVNHQMTEYSRGPASKLAITQIVFGGLSFIFAIVLIILNDPLRFIATGIWCGIIFSIAGILGIISTKSNQNNSSITACMILSILAAIFSPILLIITIADMVIVSNVHNFYMYNLNMTGLLVCNIFLIVISITEFIIAIISSVCCCRETCCKRPQYPQYVNQYQGQVQNMPLSAPGYYYPNQFQATPGQSVQLGPLPIGGVYNMPTGAPAVQILPNNQPQVPEMSIPGDVDTSLPPPYLSGNQYDKQSLLKSQI